MYHTQYVYANIILSVNKMLYLMIRLTRNWQLILRHGSFGIFKQMFHTFIKIFRRVRCWQRMSFGFTMGFLYIMFKTARKTIQDRFQWPLKSFNPTTPYRVDWLFEVHHRQLWEITHARRQTPNPIRSTFTWAKVRRSQIKGRNNFFF